MKRSQALAEIAKIYGRESVPDGWAAVRPRSHPSSRYAVGYLPGLERMSHRAYGSTWEDALENLRKQLAKDRWYIVNDGSPRGLVVGWNLPHEPTEDNECGYPVIDGPFDTEELAKEAQ